MKTKWIVTLGILGVLVSAAAIVYSKKFVSNFGRVEIDKTLSAIDKFKMMEEQGAFDFELTYLDPKLAFVEGFDQSLESKKNEKTKATSASQSNTVESSTSGSIEGAVTSVSSQPMTSGQRLSDFKGKVILLNFWASWCEPCIQEFPDMIKLVEKRPNVKIIAVNRDTNKDDALKFIDSFPEAKGKIHFYWDPKGEITSLYGTEVLPESYLIGSDFKALRKIVGIQDWDHPEVLRFIDSLQ